MTPDMFWAITLIRIPFEKTDVKSGNIPPSQIIPGRYRELYPRVDYGGSQSLPLPPKIHPPPLCDYVRCLRLPEYTPFSTTMCDPRRIPLPPRIYPHFQHLYATLPKFTPPFQNIPHFQQLYATLPESTLLLRIYSLSYLCATLPESTPPSQTMPPFQQLCETLP